MVLTAGVEVALVLELNLKLEKAVNLRRVTGRVPDCSTLSMTLHRLLLMVTNFLATPH